MEFGRVGLLGGRSGVGGTEETNGTEGIEKRSLKSGKSEGIPAIGYPSDFTAES